MKMISQEEALSLIYKYGEKGNAPDPQVVELAKAYSQLVEVCRRSKEHAEAAVESAQKVVRNLGRAEP